jgi:cytoskeletal protein CcmA (bactofilin family)
VLSKTKRFPLLYERRIRTVALFGRQKIETETHEVEQITSPDESTLKVPKQPISPPTPPAPPVTRKEGGVTVIGKGITVKGELFGEEDVKVEGHVEGKIQLTKNLLVGQTGVIEADVEAENINIGGTVTGNILAQNRVEIVASGKMMGDIKAPRVIVAEGAHFKGNVDMDTSRKVSKTNKGKSS